MYFNQYEVYLNEIEYFIEHDIKLSIYYLLTERDKAIKESTRV